MAEYVQYPKNAVIHKVLKNLSLEKALLIEPHACYRKYCQWYAENKRDDSQYVQPGNTETY
jgi:L-iditol 2-dehydrogenase